MRHKKIGRRLNRTASHRKAMFANMAASLFRHEQIKTTLPKAKELRRVAEPLITLAKAPSVANRRAAFARLRERDMVMKLFDDLGPHFAERPGGYLRIIKCGFRAGDNAPMAYVQLVGREKVGADGVVEAGGGKEAEAAGKAKVGKEKEKVAKEKEKAEKEKAGKEKGGKEK